MSQPAATNPYLHIDIATQTLSVYKDGTPQQRYRISSAKNGIGSQENSGCTPLGRHHIAEKIGTDLPMNSVFVGRVPTGEVYTPKLGAEHPERDWILTRILWLAGDEAGVNQGSNAHGCCDTYQRYIYIHGTPDTEPMGAPLSHGCIRMRNTDMLELFDSVSVGTAVHIVNESQQNPRHR
ncbi:L,D-transpeptidase [Psychrobacter aestuarii]|uniref:Cell wall-recycling L,D-carboxypeptidase ElsL n=1 Tax=Psychrobacter aestuarii TaxID=556327 RepID=A0ABP3FDD0_9GAMM|nr:L,D-transpeptidase [Psychrobacter aestuarii]